VLLRRALDASARERRRIAQHLHDGVVQDLAGVSYSLAAAGDADAAATTRGAVRELRSLLIGIYPPSLQRSGLQAAVADLLVPLSTRGIEVEADIPSDLALAPETEELIFRGAQEALRNAANHADPDRVQISVARSDGSVVLTVRDDGRGFDPTAADGADDSSLGLHLLEDLVQERNGRLRVESAAAQGTVVTMELAAG
jgi:signal transduction histidine kinase